MILQTFIDDLRTALIRLKRTPGLSLTVLSLVALPVAAATSVFSVTKAVLLDPLPYRNPSALVSIQLTDRDGREFAMSFPHYKEMKERASGFAGMAAATWDFVDMTIGTSIYRVREAVVTPDFFELLGVTPLLGQLMGSSDSESQEAVLDETAWRHYFAGDASVVGQTLRLENSPRPGAYRIVGIARSDSAPRQFPPFALYVRATHIPAMDSWRVPTFSVFARLQPGATVQSTSAPIRALAANLAQDHGIQGLNGASVVAMLEREVGRSRLPLSILMTAIGFVLLIASLNIAGILVSTGARRTHEFGVKAAMGASRFRLCRQIFVENLLLGLAGGLAGTLGAAVGIKALVAMAPADLPRLGAARLDSIVLAFAIGVSVASAVLFGLLPAILQSRTRVNELLESRGVIGKRHSKMRDSLMLVQLSLVFGILVVAVLSLGSLKRLLTLDLGLDATGVAAVEVVAGRDLVSSFDSYVALQDHLLARIHAEPIVEAAAISFALPPESVGLGNLELPSGHRIDPVYRQVSPGYFGLFGLSLVQGRLLEASDRRSRDVLINQVLAARIDGNPIGRHLTVSPTLSYRIVGVVTSAREWALTEEPRAVVYMHFQTAMPRFWLLAKGHDPSAKTSAAVRKAIVDVAPQLAIGEVTSAEARLASLASTSRFYAQTLSTFALIAALVAGIGVWASMHRAVEERVPELGVRLALGASPVAVLQLVSKRMVGVLALSIALGSAIGVGSGRAMGSLFFGADPYEVALLAWATLALVIVVAAACVQPFRRAIRVDPLDTLRQP